MISVPSGPRRSMYLAFSSYRSLTSAAKRAAPQSHASARGLALKCHAKDASRRGAPPQVSSSACFSCCCTERIIVFIIVSLGHDCTGDSRLPRSSQPAHVTSALHSPVTAAAPATHGTVWESAAGSGEAGL